MKKTKSKSSTAQIAQMYSSNREKKKSINKYTRREKKCTATYTPKIQIKPHTNLVNYNENKNKSINNTNVQLK